MFISLAIILSTFAMLITLKVVNRISKLEDDLSSLKKELAELRSRHFEKTSVENQTSGLHSKNLNAQTRSPVDSTLARRTPTRTEPDSTEPENKIPPELWEPSVPKMTTPLAEPNIQPTDDVHIAGLAQSSETLFEKQASKLLNNIQENWLVWVGALAMLMGGGYLVQVIGSHIEFSPIMRVSIALSISLVTVLLGEWFHHREQKSLDRAKRAQGFTYVPAAISGTGLTGIYCTVIFAFVFYQMLTPGASLLILASAAFFSLALSLRQGPLMAILGLIGGYSAPLWIGGTEPDYYLLTSYISAISIAATLLMQRVRHSWMSPCIAGSHFIWMLLLIENIPTDTLFSWLAVFLSLTAYLLFAVPRLGWILNPRFRHNLKKWTHIPTGLALAIVLLILSALVRLPSINPIQMSYLYTILGMLLWLPAIRAGWSLRIYLPSILVVFAASLMLSLALHLLYMPNSETLILIAQGIFITLIAVRTLCQILANDRSQMATGLFLVLVPTMTLLVLLYTNEFVESHVLSWTIFTTAVAAYYLLVGLRYKALALECSAIIHTMIAGTAFIWLSDTWVTTAISIQIAVMALQVQSSLFRPASWAIKLLMGILIVRLTLLPFIPDWQPVDAGHWAWVSFSYLPSLVILAYARSVLQHSENELANWFEGAFLHVFLMALFTQTNYWLTGQYGYLGYLDFNSAIIFANQALVMGLVYSYRSQFAQQLKRMYQVYSYLLWCIFLVLIALINSLESPLLVNNVSAQAMPVFNMLSVGWLSPAMILIVTAYKRWNTLHIPSSVIASIGFTLGAIWLGMSIRQFWQTTSMTLAQPTSMVEMFTYSVTGLLIGGVLTWRGVTRKIVTIQRIGLVVLACVALKVFLWDVRSLDGFWRAISFLGLGASLIALGWLFQKLHRSVAYPIK